ncbi:hypothetical protein BGZ61DRAFT_351543 [Ilyonectria robusta]|uniref:uncharacterized protein n=1 Tax=Ilyonectria robusta TaxID=1079257 RepID=UPI001E8EBAF4|nr:uncharacterized protein BGZ61DRAFT_351543 [Ilyonectria robusta]KAH8699567.1 hypothetical protein BGZ61DRAFT_351543 [Ilyonectria robusta]
MGAWETDDEYLSGPAATSLPTPQDTPYRTPSRTSRRSRRSVTPPGKGNSPPPMPSEKGSKRSSRDITTDETISILDPRRFTPTLHANLVSEILTLRRDQEEKLRQIETLESALDTTREERETLQENLVNTGKESRSLKRQLSLLEGGTSSALGELARERDDAVESIADVKKRLEIAQKKIRNQEDDSQRVHDLLAQEKDNWEEEKRKYERKIHVAESRLKLVLDEVAAYQAAQAQNGGAGHESEVDESGRENDAASVRTMSMTNSVRFSFMTGPGSMKPNGHSLADELNFDDEDEQSDFDGRESALSNHNPYAHARNMSRDSVINRLHHRRNQSLESLKRSGSVARGRLFMNQSVLEALEGEDEEVEPPAPKVSYTDTGIQFSPPPSPKLPVAKPMTPEPSLSRAKSPEVECSPRGDGEIEANQRRKRVHITRPLSIEPVPRKLMVSTSSQTIEEPPLTPPKTPKSPMRPPPPPPPPKVKTPLMVASSMQTDPPSPPPRTFTFPPMPPSPPLIPSISVHPPTSRPATPREPRLPQYFKDFGCQVSLSSPVSTCEAAVQTEGIQTDKRLALLPAHLQPSNIRSRPTSPNPPSSPFEPSKHFTPIPGNVPPRNPRRLTNRRDTGEMPSSPISIADSDMTHDAYPGNNDDGPLSSQKAPMRRPHRFSSLFAGFDGGSSDEIDEFGDVDLSDSEYRTALSAPRPKSISSRPGKRSSTGTTTTNGTIPTSPEQITVRQVSRGSMKPFASELYNFFSGEKDLTHRVSVSGKSGRAFEKSPAAMSSNRASVMRKAAMIQNGIASHQGRSRSPSLQDSKNPPFPIPTRASSRKPPFSSSAPSDGQRSPTRGDNFFRRGTGRSHHRAGSIRKVRSAAALPRNQRRRRQGSRSPPPLSPSTEAPESPRLPPLPRNDITTPRNRVRGGEQFRHKHQLSVTTANTVNTVNTMNTVNTDNTMSTDPPTVGNGAQSNSVVDAIAQTMVGEWMFKYVRRRKSFGVPESNSKDENSNDRHKRWVWLAPYERAILWSSKQPSSGSALMGKTGRKLTIQSVLDVKDDNAAPKGSPALFNRSILILTPQRALKFTATSADRHYIWLTALSFLAHSSQAVPEIMSAPPPPEHLAPLPDFDIPRIKMKRSGIRDSIRLAKGRTHVSRAATPSVPSIPSAPSSQMGDLIPFPLTDSVGGISSNHSRDGSADAAEPPFIPRFHDRSNPTTAHSRKRSNTGGHVPPPLSFRGFSGPIGGSHHAPTNSTAGASTGTAGSSDIYQSQASSAGTWPVSQAVSQRTSEASSRPSNFFDAIGTMRMEAFISPLAPTGFGDFPNEQDEFRHEIRRRSKEHRRRQSRSRHRDSYNSRGTRGTDDYYNGSRTAGEEDFFRDDPFKGF